MDGEEGRQIVEKVVGSLHSMVARLEEEEERIKLENIYLKERLSKEYAPSLVIGPIFKIDILWRIGKGAYLKSP
ncbi:hypothetical protein KKH56_07415 [bacterium]|nr:hypothetical protein [bacterium]